LANWRLAKLGPFACAGQWRVGFAALGISRIGMTDAVVLWTVLLFVEGLA